MRVLLIEDDEYKAKQIIEFLTNTLDKRLKEVILKKAYQSGMDSIVNGFYDLILLDMSMPTFEATPGRPSGRSRPYGGRDILYEMRRKELKIPTIVVTQHKFIEAGVDSLSMAQLDELLKVEFNSMYLGLVYYNASTIDWKDKLFDLIELKWGNKSD